MWAEAWLILLVFALIKRAFGGKLLGSDVFGRAEYYLGMGSGLVRFGCMLLVALALLNARYFSPTEVRAMEKYNDDVYGSDYFPSLHSVQEAVFEKSVTGPLIRQHLGFLLIKPTEPEKKEFHQKDFGHPQYEKLGRPSFNRILSPARRLRLRLSLWPACFLPRPANASALPATSWT